MMLVIFSLEQEVINIHKALRLLHFRFCKPVVERPLMVRWVVASIPHGGPI